MTLTKPLEQKTKKIIITVLVVMNMTTLKMTGENNLFNYLCFVSARGLAVGDLKAIHVPDETIQKERNLIRYCARLVGDINRSKKPV